MMRRSGPEYKEQYKSRPRYFWNTFSSKAVKNTMPEKERPGFEGDDLHWLDVDGQEEYDIMNIDNDKDRQLGASPSFHYSVDQQSEGGGNGGDRGTNDIVTSQSSRPSLRDINPTMSDHNSRRGEEYEEETIAHTYHRLRKAKDKATKAPPYYDNQVAHSYVDKQQMPSTFTAPGYCNWSCGSNDWGTSSDQSYPSYPGSESHFTQSNPSTQNHANFQVFNHGTINYGDHHYYRPTIHGGDSSSTSQFWMDATSSCFFQEQGIDRCYTADQNEKTNYQEPACHTEARDVSFTSANDRPGVLAPAASYS
ncbi:hypothetical protein Cgig2_027372 [Carnegiea gigantea]|uniref:Uncharacterized protein n=1 Tax=Carnegiea gigantea TaxID=171969 RepID=A0A9Q1QGK3_9CARY|nr:hypothetical protein Cgig2_027372 [Carnegiea gigantea]